MSKIKIELEGWHCLPKKETKILLDVARIQFNNANFIDNSGLLIESDDDVKVLKFCLEIIINYKNYLGSWDGYSIKKISKRIIYNYQDKKRKLTFENFKRLITENKPEDTRIVLAGILYLDSDEIRIILSSIEREMCKLFIEMDTELLKNAYNLLIKYASMTIRKFSLDNK